MGWFVDAQTVDIRTLVVLPGFGVRSISGLGLQANDKLGAV